MLRNSSRLLTLVLLCGVGPAEWPLQAAEPVKTGEKRETLLYVRTDPPGAKVLLNGKELGTTTGLFPVEPGPGTMVIELQGHKVDERQVVIRASGVTRIMLKLKTPAAPVAQSPTPPPGNGNVPVPNAFAGKRTPFVIGPDAFTKGDKIVIQEIRSQRGTLTTGDIVSVKGIYALTSHRGAKLACYITADAKGPQDTARNVERQIPAGTAPFEITRPVTVPGHLHLAFYDLKTGKCFGTIYFGTESQMQEIAHWKVESWIH